MLRYHHSHTCERAARDKSTSGLGDKIICFGLYWIVKFAGLRCATKSNLLSQKGYLKITKYCVGQKPVSNREIYFVLCN